METTVITRDTPMETIERFGDIMGKTLKPHFAEKRYAQACSSLISINVVQTLGMCATHLNGSLSAMTSDKLRVYWWITSAPVMRALLRAVPMWCNTMDVRVISSAPILKSKQIERVPFDISVGMYLFCMFAVWYGATPDCKRRILNNKETASLTKAVRTLGADGILTQLWMAVAQYVSLTDKVFEPAWERMTSGRDERSLCEIIKDSPQPACECDNVASGFHQLKDLLEARHGRR